MTLQQELLNTRTCTIRAELGKAIFEYIEAWYNLTATSRTDRPAQISATDRARNSAG